jgi:hypothetical protein
LPHLKTSESFEVYLLEYGQSDCGCSHIASSPVKNLKIRIYKIIILSVVLCECETWSLTLREEHGLKVFETRVLRRIFGPKRNEVTGGWRKLHNEELHDLYSSPSIIRIMKARRVRWAGHVARMGRRGTRIGCWCKSQSE